LTANAGRGRTDSETRFIAAPAEVIYRAFVNPAAWPLWLPPDGMTGEVFEFDGRPGGIYRMALTYRDGHPNAGKSSDSSDVVQGRFAELVPNERVVQLVTFQSDDPVFAGEMRMTWSLSPAIGGTDVSIVAENVPMGISKADHAVGMRSTLNKLARFVE